MRHYPSGNAEQLETRTVSDWLAKDGRQLPDQARIGEAIGRILCGPSSAWEREERIAAALRAAQVAK